MVARREPERHSAFIFIFEFSALPCVRLLILIVFFSGFFFACSSKERTPAITCFFFHYLPHFRVMIPDEKKIKMKKKKKYENCSWNQIRATAVMVNKSSS